ncbi:MAG TPA: AAA family ATPase [Streptosporangiaceae bacterium]
MRCPILIGRQEPVALIADAVRGLSRHGHSAAIVVTGEAGVGKTRLAEHIRMAAADARLISVTGRALPGPLDSALRPIAELILAVTRDRQAPADTELAPYVQVLAALVPHWRGPDWSVPAEHILVTAEAVLRILRWATDGAGVIVILEDLHWADDATLAVTRYLADHASEVPVVIFASVRTGDGRDDVAAVLEAGGAQVCSLGRLSDAESRDMARACAGPSPASDDTSETIAAVVRDAEGLPLLVEDLLAAGDLGELPPRFAATVKARLARLDEPQRLVLGAASMLGRHFGWRLLAPTAGVSANVVTAGLHRSAALQLVTPEGDGFAFRHALTREVILADVPTGERASLSRRAADALLASTPPSRDPGRALTIGRFLAEGGDQALAAKFLLEAGGAAFAAGDFGSAVQLLQEAVASAGSIEALRITVDSRLAQVLLHAGQPAEAARIAARTVAVADGSDPQAATAMRLVLARAAVMTAAWEEAHSQLTSVRHAQPADAAVTAEVAVIEAQIALGDSRVGSRAGAEHLAAKATALATGAGRPDLACEALETLASCARLRDLDAAAAAFTRALDVAADASLRVHRLRILNELGTVEMLRDARGDRLEQARAEALLTGAVGLAVGIGANIAALYAMTARFEDAIEVASEVEQTAERLGITPLRAAALLMQGFVYAHQGRTRDMERCLTAAESAAPDDPDLHAGAWAIGRGLNALLAEDRPGARQAFARARQEAPDQHARILNPYDGPELLLRSIAGEADQQETDAALASIVNAARWPALWFGAAQAAARGAAGDATGASAALGLALEAGSRYPVFSALVRRLIAEAAIRDQWGEPEGLLLSADAMFTQLRLGRASAACRALLKSAGRPAPRRRAADASLPTSVVAAGITVREAEVLELLADRLSNREIADLLFISPRTAEKHVASLMAKLDVQDRNALASLARTMR